MCSIHSRGSRPWPTPTHRPSRRTAAALERALLALAWRSMHVTALHCTALPLILHCTALAPPCTRGRLIQALPPRSRLSESIGRSANSDLPPTAGADRHRHCHCCCRRPLSCRRAATTTIRCEHPFTSTHEQGHCDARRCHCHCHCRFDWTSRLIRFDSTRPPLSVCPSLRSRAALCLFSPPFNLSLCCRWMSSNNICVRCSRVRTS